MTIGLQTAAYLSATVLFILALGGLSNQEKPNVRSGMGLSAWPSRWWPLADSNVSISELLIGAIVIGTVIGVIVALRVEMTECCNWSRPFTRLSAWPRSL